MARTPILTTMMRQDITSTRRSMQIRPTWITFLLLLFLAACKQANAPESGTHGHAHSSESMTIWTEALELYLEHPPMVAGVSSGPWVVHVTQLQSTSPIMEGVLTLAFRAPDGTVFTTRSEAPVRPGIFTPAPVLPTPGSYDLVVDIDSPSLKDRFRAEATTVYRSEADVPHDEDDAAEYVTFMKEQQWTVPFATDASEVRDMTRSISASGSIAPAAGHIAEVASPVSGLALARENLYAPAPGDRIREGQVLVTLAPTSQDDSYTRTRADVERLTRETDRLQRLFEVEAIPEKRLIEAKHDLELARTALAAMGGSVETSNDYGFPVRAPIAGTVQERLFIPGARIDTGQPLYRIVDPKLVWLKVQLPVSRAATLESLTGAHFTIEGSDRVYQTDRTVSIASMIDAATRTLPIILAVNNSDESLKIGYIAQVQLHSGESQSGVVIPNTALLMESGLPTAYVQTGGESFERRLLILGPSDGTHTLVRSGLAAGERVVTEGAYQVYLASLNTSEISDHGHPH